jgi:hypothetical protein
MAQQNSGYDTEYFIYNVLILRLLFGFRRDSGCAVVRRQGLTEPVAVRAFNLVASHNLSPTLGSPARDDALNYLLFPARLLPQL